MGEPQNVDLTLVLARHRLILDQYPGLRDELVSLARLGTKKPLAAKRGALDSETLFGAAVGAERATEEALHEFEKYYGTGPHDRLSIEWAVHSKLLTATARTERVMALLLDLQSLLGGT